MENKPSLNKTENFFIHVPENIWFESGYYSVKDFAKFLEKVKNMPEVISFIAGIID